MEEFQAIRLFLVTHIFFPAASGSKLGFEVVLCLISSEGST